MTAFNRRPTRATRSRVVRNAPFKVRPLPALAIAVVLAIFIAGLVIGGLPGGLMIGVLVLVAAVLLALRWTAIDPRIRLFRLGVVVLCLAVAITVVVRG